MSYIKILLTFASDEDCLVMAGVHHLQQAPTYTYRLASLFTAAEHTILFLITMVIVTKGQFHSLFVSQQTKTLPKLVGDRTNKSPCCFATAAHTLSIATLSSLTAAIAAHGSLLRARLHDQLARMVLEHFSGAVSRHGDGVYHGTYKHTSAVDPSTVVYPGSRENC